MKKQFWVTALIILIIIYLLTPLLATATYSAFKKWTGILPEGFTLKHYTDLLSNRPFMLSLGRTILVCIIPIVITVVVVLLALFVVTITSLNMKICSNPVYDPLYHSGCDSFGQYSFALSRHGGFLGDRKVMLIGAYCIIILPYIYQDPKQHARSICPC